jgi:hypothetical protein
MLEIWCSEGALVERRTEDNVSAVVEDGMSETLWVLRTKLLSAIEASHMHAVICQLSVTFGSPDRVLKSLTVCRAGCAASLGEDGTSEILRVSKTKLLSYNADKAARLPTPVSRGLPRVGWSRA